MLFPGRREKSEVRRQQIVEATLGLLADTPLEQLSTRQIARQLGISQPALFRHFGSRDEILLEVIATTRRSLASVAERILDTDESPAEQLAALARELLEHLAENPGLPRLLFANVASGAGPVLLGIQQLHSMQSSLIAELVRQGQRDGLFDPSIQPRDAATAFVGFLQGATLVRRLEQRTEPLQIEGRRLFELWLRSVRSLEPASPSAPPRAAEARVPRAAPSPDGLRHLDVRPLLSKGIDPLDSILEALESVGPQGVLKLTVPFRPAPLLALLSSRGHRVRDEQSGAKQWSVEVVHGGGPEPEDLRELEAPGPLERVLSACSALGPGGVYLARLPRHPRMLLPHLEERGLSFAVHDEADGSAFLRVVRK